MKRLLLAGLFLFFTCLYAYGDTEVVGLPGGGGGVSEGSDVVFGFGTFSSVLDEATGDETALTVNYEVNKATSGTTSGLDINMTDTLSPGANYFIKGSRGGTIYFSVQDSGALVANAGVVTAKVEERTNNATLEIRSRPTFSTAGTGVKLQGLVTSSTSTGQFNAVSIEQIYNQSGDATSNSLAILSIHSSIGTTGATDFTINRMVVSEGSGPQLLIDTQVDDVSMFSVNTHGSSDTGGAVAFSGISTATVDYVIGNFEDDPTWFIECDATLGNISTTLPPFADKKGRLLEVKLMSAANGCYLDGNGAETIDGVAGQAITTQYNIISLIAGAAEWLIR